MDKRQDSRVCVRKMTPGDARAIEEISRLAIADLRKVYRPTPSFFMPKTSRKQLPQLVAEIDGRVVGTVTYRLEDLTLHAMSLFTHPDHRRCGVARALLDSLADIARSSGKTCLSLNTIVQTGNVPIFERLGFIVIEEFTPVDAERTSGGEIREAYLERDV
jgi:GNAT superfamily N-acetyltransferase